MAFARLIAHLRAKAHRTIDALWHEIGHIHDLFEPAERQNSFTAAGYGFSRASAALVDWKRLPHAVRRGWPPVLLTHC